MVTRTPAGESTPVNALQRDLGFKRLGKNLAIKGHPLTLIAIFALGAIFRLTNLGLIRMTYDNSYTIYDALRGLAGAGWPSIGQASSVFLPSPVLMTYVEALPLLISRSPWAVTLFIVLLNTLAIGCVYRAASQLLGRTVGYLAATLFAINPWIVFYSRETWVSCLMPLFVPLVASLIWPILISGERSAGRIGIAALAIAAMTQSYVTSWGLLIPIGLLLVLLRPNIPRRLMLLGIAIVAIGFVLYGLSLLPMWDLTLANINKFLAGGSEQHVTAEGINHALRFVTGMDFDAQYGELTLGSNILRTISPIIYAVLTLALIGGIGLALRAIWQKREHRRAGIILLVWFFVPVLAMTVTSHPVHPYYLLLSVPAGHVLAAWGLRQLGHLPRGRMVVGAVLASSALAFGLNWHWFNVNIALHPTQPKLDGWTLESGVQLGNTIRDLTAYNSVSPRLVVDARPSLPGSLSGKAVQLISGLDYPNYVVLPGADPLLYVMMTSTQQAAIFGPQAELMTDRTLRFSDGTQTSFIRVQPYTRSAALALPQKSIDWPSAAGLSLLGYTVKQPIVAGGDLDLTTYWRVDELRPGYDQWFIGAFYQLFDKTGQQVANADGHGQYARRWQQGDVYVEHITLTLPTNLAPGMYSLRTGLIDGIHSQAYPFELTANSQPSIAIPVSVTNP